MPDLDVEHECGAYPLEDECSWCGGVAERRHAATMQGVWYACRDCTGLTLVIDWCECEEDQ